MHEVNVNVPPFLSKRVPVISSDHWNIKLAKDTSAEVGNLSAVLQVSVGVSAGVDVETVSVSC